VDTGSLAVSASTVYRVMRDEGLTTDRSGRSHRNGNSRKPDRPELTGPTSGGAGYQLSADVGSGFSFISMRCWMNIPQGCRVFVSVESC